MSSPAYSLAALARAASLAAAALGIPLAAAPALATTFVDVGPEEMARESAAVVVARCEAVESRLYETADGPEVATFVTFTVLETLKGPVEPGRLVVRQTGGRVGDVEQFVDGSPAWRTGRVAALFLASDGEGAYVTYGLAMGHWPIEMRAGGEWVVRQAAGERACVLRKDGSHAEGERSLSLFELRRIAREAGRSPAAEPAASPVPPEYDARPFAKSQGHSEFSFLHNQRWFETDDGGEVVFYANPTGFGPGLAAMAAGIEAGALAWSGVPGSSMRVRYAGVSDSGCGWKTDGVTRVSVDCRNQIAGEGCRSVIAIGGGVNIRTGETRTVNGVRFSRTVEADICLQDGACDLWGNPENFAEVIGHEMGHCFGLGHSSDREALMFGYAKADGRGARLSEDDRAGLRAIYPAVLSVAADPLPPARLGQAYEARLSAEGGQAPYVWAIKVGAPPAGITLEASGALSGTPSAQGLARFEVDVTDAVGRKAARELSIEVGVSALSVPSQSLPRLKAGNPPAVRLAASGGLAPYAWALKSGQLPEGITLDASGALAGLPLRTGSARFEAEVRDAAGQVASRAFTLSVDRSPVEISRARYSASKPGLVVDSRDLAEGAAVEINGRAAGRLRINTRRGRLTAEGSRRELNLRSGDNVVVLIVGGIRSLPYTVKVAGATAAKGGLQ